LEEKQVSNCIFCKIAQGEIPSEFLYEDDEVVAFNDLQPQAPTHILVIPKRHITTLNDLEAADASLVGKMVMVAAELAKKAGFAEEGYRTLLNCNAAGGQSVFHIHLHLLGGRQMTWPPG